MDFIRNFNQITKEDVRLAGGKGASLGEMTQAGIPVPPGFVILSYAFEKFLEETDLNVEIDSVLHSVNHKEIHTVENASEKIQALILGAEIPKDIGLEIKKHFQKLKSKFVAVRSSATAEDSSAAAWAGQLDTFLNTTENTLLNNVKRCWASLFTPRAIFYRFEKELHKQKILVAVVVQKMIQSEVSGVAFSVHPVTQDFDQLIIEAGFGLGEAIVSGQITPDSYVVEKSKMAILDKNINVQEKALRRSAKGGNEWYELSKTQGESQVLTDQEILDLSKLIIQIENHYGFPCDIEWAREKGEFYITQSRPITTLQNMVVRPNKEDNVRELNFKNRKWVVYGASGWPAYITPFAVAPAQSFYKIYGISNEGIALWRGKNFDWLYDENQLIILAKKVLPTLIQEKWEYFKKWKMSAKKFDDLHYKLMATDLNKLKETQFSKVMKQYYKAFMDQYTISNIVEPLSFYLQGNLGNMLKKEGVNPDEAKELIGQFGTSKKSNYLKLCIEEYTKAPKKIQMILKKYHFINNDYTGTRPFTEVDLKELVSKNWNNHKFKIKKIKVPLKVKKLLEILQMTATIQDVRKAESLMWISGAEKLLKEVSRRTDIQFKYLLNASWTEIADKKIDQSELEKRISQVIFHWHSNGESIYVNDRAEKIKEEYLKTIVGDTKDIKELKGVAASSGIAKGKATVVLNVSQFAKVKKGDILITVMTRPEYLSVMHLAAAFVTDEGGITSHAAIVAREMKKPCIIATKIATKVLKDGDSVEVDANNGIVRILEKNQEEAKTGVTINGVEWNLFVTRNMSFWHQVISNFGHYHHAKDWGMRIPLQLLHLTVHGTQTHVFKTSKNAYAFDAEVLEIFSTEQKIAKIKQFYEIFAKELLNRLDQCLKELTLETWAAFCESYGRFTHGLAVTATMGRIGMDQLAKKLQELKTLESEIPSVISAITYPSQHTPLFNSSLDMLKIGEKIQSGKLKKKAIEKELKIWLKKYGHIPVNFVDEPWSLDDAKKQLENFLQKDCRKEIEALNANHAKRSSASDKLLKKIGDKKISLLAHALQEATYLNEFRKNVFSKVSLKMRPLFIQIAAKAGSKSWKDCYYLTPDEILDIFKGKIQSIGNIVKKRDIVGMYTTEKGELAFLNETETKEVYGFIQSLHSKVQSTKEAEILRGFSANSGHIKGIVKIILNSKDFSKLQPGEILVTTMTSVDFVPVMEKAAAFVTNEGGITSHAAIVAREMNKPCIIGTKIATKVLKDGDTVEVDADNGVVKIIK